jgi:8-oxo-dGTP pyrophosphatase MutT (NUDIX family)
MALNTLADYERDYPYPRKVTLCYLINEEKGMVLLAMKKRGFGTGKWNGVGGKLDKGESVEQALVRETKEEIGVDLISFKKIGVIKFYFSEAQDRSFDQEVNVYTADSWKGSPSESDEMSPRWFGINEIPFDQMWSDDRFWLSDALNGKYVEASFMFDGSGNVKQSSIRLR